MDAMTIEQMLIVALFCAIAVPFGLIGLWRLLVAAVEWSAPDRRFTQRDHVAEAKRRVTHSGFKSRQGIRDRRCV